MSNISPSTRRTIRATFTSIGRAKRLIGKRMQIRKGVPTRVALVGAIVAVATAGSALAFQALPLGSQVNDDAAAGIDKTISVNGEDPTNADVAGGALTAGKPAVPWAVLRQQETNGSPPPHDQVFARSFAGGAWTTRGNGTVGGRSSASPTFSGSLNFDQSTDGEAPAIDFAGAGRTVPWASWYENTSGTGFENNNVFASRFDNTGDANQGKWIFAGQSRGTGAGTMPVPSLNIHTDQSAENPSVAGGSAVDPTKPGPWVTWQETTNLPVSRVSQIFVSRPIGPGAANCDGVKPAGVEVGGHVPAIGGFCWQQTGIPRVGTGGADPSLNIDPTRNGVEPNIAFTGSQDSVPWVVWYEQEPTGIPGLHDNEMVFAAKGVNDGEGANGGFHWVGVGSQLSATLDTSGTNGFGACAESATNEEHCSLNKTPKSDAENPRVAAGTMNPANPTVPWVAWDEDLGGVKQVFVSRLVGAGASAHFEVLNNGAPISVGANDSTRPAPAPASAHTIGKRDGIGWPRERIRDPREHARLVLGAGGSDVHAGAQADGQRDLRGPQADLGHGTEEGHEEGRCSWDGQCHAERRTEPNLANRAERHRQAAARKPSQADGKAPGHPSNRQRNCEDGLYTDRRSLHRQLPSRQPSRAIDTGPARSRPADPSPRSRSRGRFGLYSRGGISSRPCTVVPARSR